MILFLNIDREPEMIGHHNNVQTSHLQVEPGVLKHVRPEDNQMNHGIVVVVVNRDLKIGVDRMKTVLGVYAKEHV